MGRSPSPTVSGAESAANTVTTKNDAPNDDMLYTGSCLSSLLSVCVILRYVHDRVLGWDTPIRDYLQEYHNRKDEVGLKATLRDLAAQRIGYPEDKLCKQPDSFRFLGLPAEIRNIFYIYNLSTSSGNVHLVRNGNGYFFADDDQPIDGPTKPVNCINNTFLQLMREFRGLELRANDPVAHGRAFDHFLSSNDIRLKHYLRRVTLSGNFLPYQNSHEALFQRVVDFAWAYKNATVHVRVFDLHLDPGRHVTTFLNIGYVIDMAVRGTGHSPFSNGPELAK
ncbi:hypothetical protein EJ02DRAFT_420644 [Clathrospora elynae]|uniref:Uncharacterized protein n=1 Tax=Clathrospora elynae TaxID=706981 RepID=A0A6A5STW1_9PLEO|nr:hypothetical protein EJ02DRAFT_420644 [Clathrospora elynae]